MAYSTAERNDLQYRQNGLQMLMDELIQGMVNEHETMTLALIRTRTAGRGIDSAETDRLITHYDALGALMDS